MPKVTRPTPQMEAYCVARAQGQSMLKSYRSCYGTGKMKHNQIVSNAKKLEAKPMIAARISELSARATDVAVAKLGVSKAWVMEQLVENVEMAKTAKPVLDPKGEPTGEYKANLAAANKALELLGKEIGMFREPKTEQQDEVSKALTHGQRVALRDLLDEWIAGRADGGSSEDAAGQPAARH